MKTVWSPIDSDNPHPIVITPDLRNPPIKTDPVDLYDPIVRTVPLNDGQIKNKTGSYVPDYELIEPKSLEMGTHKGLPKIDTYDRKYLEMLEKNKNKFALVFRNLDLYSDTEIDKQFNKLRSARISFLTEDPTADLIGVVNECASVLDTQTNKIGEVCLKYYTPIYKQSDKIKLLRKLEPRLKKPKHLSRIKHEIVVNNLHITQDELITKEEYEISEGAKIMSWIEHNLVYYGGYNTELYNTMMFSDLLYLQYKGHIYLTKAGVKQQNVVTSDVIELKYLTDQYDKPIDTSELILKMQNDKSNPIHYDKSKEIRIEAEKILALEYYICLQPEPRYMLYILKRLIVAWYSDFDLIRTITKIRILINQFRCRRDQETNLKFGVLPSILVYIRYGPSNFNQVLSKLNYYFTNYIHTGWVGNEPDFFTRYNNLIYYSNGSPDAKRFFEHLPISTQMEIYKPYTINPTAFLNNSEDINS